MEPVSSHAHTNHTQHGNPARLWASVTSTQQPLLEALDVLIKRASWRDSIVALLLMPLIVGLRQMGAGWLWLTRRQMRTRWVGAAA